MDDYLAHEAEDQLPSCQPRHQALWDGTWSEGDTNTLADFLKELPSTVSGMSLSDLELECTAESCQQDQLPSTAAHHLCQQQHHQAPPPQQHGAAPLAAPTAAPPPPPPHAEQAAQLPPQLDLQQQLQLLAQLLLAQQHAHLQQQPEQAQLLPMQLQQQQQQVAQPLLQQQRQRPPRVVVPLPDGPPPEGWLQETARLLSSPEGGSKNTGLRRLGDMMWGLSTYLDAKGYELPTGFPKEVLGCTGPTASLLITRGRAVGSKQTSGSWKSGPQPFEVAEGGVYLVNVYYNRCSCGKTRTKACEEKRHPYTNVYPFALAFFEPDVRTCSWDREAKRCGVPAPGCLKDHPQVYYSEPKPKSAGGQPAEDPRPSSKRKAYIDMWVSTKVMAYLSVLPHDQQQQQQQQQLQEVQPQEQHQQQQGGPTQPPVLSHAQAPLPPHHASLQAPPHLETVLPPPLHMQQQLQLHHVQELPQQQDGPQPIRAVAAAAGAATPLDAWVPSRNHIWSFLLSCQHFGRPVLDGTCLAGSPPAAGGTHADAPGQSTGLQEAELLSCWRALLAEVPPEHLVAMRADKKLGKGLEGQCLAHWLVTPPDRLQEPFQKPIPRDPDVPLPESLAVQMVQAAIDRLGLELWRSLLSVADTDHKATALHRVCCFGHRLQLVALMFQHAPRGALLCSTRNFWLPYHSAFRRAHYPAGLMYLREVEKFCGELAAAGPGSGSGAAAAATTSTTTSSRELLQRVVYTLINGHLNKHVEGRPSGHDLLVQACGDLGLGVPRLVNREETWEVLEAYERVRELMDRCSVLDTAEALQGLGLRQGQGGVEEQEGGAPGSKRPRGG